MTNIHTPDGIRTRNPKKQAAAELRRRPRGYWDQLVPQFTIAMFKLARCVQYCN